MLIHFLFATIIQKNTFENPLLIDYFRLYFNASDFDLTECWNTNFRGPFSEVYFPIEELCSSNRRKTSLVKPL